MRKPVKYFQVIDLKQNSITEQKEGSMRVPAAPAGPKVLHTICGQDCAQACGSMPSPLIYIVYIALRKNVASMEKARFCRPIALQNGTFPPLP